MSVLQREGVGPDGLDRSRARPPQQPVLAVGEYAGAQTLAGRPGLGQVIVQLPDVNWVGVQAAGGADPPLCFNEGVQRGQVHGAAGNVRRRIFLVDFVAPGQAGEDEKVPHRTGDVGLRLAVIMPPQYFRRTGGILRVVIVKVCGHDCHIISGAL